MTLHITQIMMLTGLFLYGVSSDEHWYVRITLIIAICFASATAYAGVCNSTSWNWYPRDTQKCLLLKGKIVACNAYKDPAKRVACLDKIKVKK